MNRQGPEKRILCAEDDPDDRLLLTEAFNESGCVAALDFVSDGEEALDYLFRRGKYAKFGQASLPRLILLDLNMPRKNGFEVLREVKSNRRLRSIPVVVLSTSTAEADIQSVYDMWVNSFIIKPGRFDSLVNIMHLLGKYWLEVVELPDSIVGDKNGE